MKRNWSGFRYATVQVATAPNTHLCHLERVFWLLNNLNL